MDDKNNPVSSGQKPTVPDQIPQQPMKAAPAGSMPATPPPAGKMGQAGMGQPKTPGKKTPFMMMLMMLLLVAAVAAAVYFALSYYTAKDDVGALESRVASLDADTHALPDGAIKVSECVPNMGFHYLDKNGDPRLGPFYLVNQQGEVIGLEFMYNQGMMTTLDIPAEVFAQAGEEAFPIEVLTNGPINLHDWQFKNIEMSRSPEGHIGFEEDHMDLHLYTVPPEVQAVSCA